MTYLGDSTVSVEKAEVIVKKEEIVKKKRVPSITEGLPHAFRKSRKLYPYEISYVKDVYGDSIRYDKVRITRDHWFSAGSTRVVGNTINFASNWGSAYLFEDTSEWGLNKAGLDLLGHEILKKGKLAMGRSSARVLANRCYPGRSRTNRATPGVAASQAIRRSYQRHALARSEGESRSALFDLL